MPETAQPPSAQRYKFDFPSSLFSCQKFSPLFQYPFSSSFIPGVNPDYQMKWNGREWTAWSYSRHGNSLHLLISHSQFIFSSIPSLSFLLLLNTQVLLLLNIMTFFPLLNYVPISGEQSVLSAGCWINIECSMIPAITTEMGISKPQIIEVLVEVCASCALGSSSWFAMDNFEISKLDLEERVCWFLDPIMNPHILSSFQLVHVFLPVQPGRWACPA